MKPGKEVSFFTVVEQIGGGGFGDVWKVLSSEDDKFYAMKLETPKAKRQSLRFEAAVLKKLQKSERFPKFLLDGNEDGCYFLVEEMLGPNLTMIHNKLPAQVILQPYIARLADEMLSCIEDFHSCGYIHRDIKPQNFVVRLDGDTPVCLIDYGISRLYKDNRGQHLDARENLAAIGSPHFASPSMHDRAELGRKDDLICWLYSVLALSQFGLPWLGETSPYEVGRLKHEHSLVSLCEPLGQGFVAVAEHIESLEYADAPDYQFMHEQLESEMAHTAVPFEWMELPPEKPVEPGGKWDPTGFLVAMSPFLQPPEEGKCLLI